MWKKSVKYLAYYLVLILLSIGLGLLVGTIGFNSNTYFGFYAILTIILGPVGFFAWCDLSQLGVHWISDFGLIYSSIGALIIGSLGFAQKKRKLIMFNILICFWVFSGYSVYSLVLIGP